MFFFADNLVAFAASFARLAYPRPSEPIIFLFLLLSVLRQRRRLAHDFHHFPLTRPGARCRALGILLSLTSSTGFDWIFCPRKKCFHQMNPSEYCIPTSDSIFCSFLIKILAFTPPPAPSLSLPLHSPPPWLIAVSFYMYPPFSVPRLVSWSLYQIMYIRASSHDSESTSSALRNFSSTGLAELSS